MLFPILSRGPKGIRRRLRVGVSKCERVLRLAQMGQPTPWHRGIERYTRQIQESGPTRCQEWWRKIVQRQQAGQRRQRRQKELGG